jgi:hypothetical protein
VSDNEKTFRPTDHLMNLKGKDYLPVAARVLWFREKFPPESGWSIDTHLDDGGFEKNFAVYRCEIKDPEGRLIASGHNVETVKGFGDFMQKAETGAIGRALATLGFGTIAALDEGEVVDSPVQRGSRPPAADPVPEGRGACEWNGCGQIITPQQAKATRAQFQKLVCKDHIKDAAAAKVAGRPLS